MVIIEEHEPLPEGPSVGALVARVQLAIARTAAVMDIRIRGLDTPDTEEDTDYRLIGLFADIAATAITAMAHLSMTAGLTILELKMEMLTGLDSDAKQWLIEEEEDFGEYDPEFFLRAVTALTVGAAEGLLRWELWSAEDPCDEDDDEVEPDDQIAESLAHVALMATLGAQWLDEYLAEDCELCQELEPPGDSH